MFVSAGLVGDGGIFKSPFIHLSKMRFGVAHSSVRWRFELKLTNRSELGKGVRRRARGALELTNRSELYSICDIRER